jgi:hypothetical protein
MTAWSHRLVPLCLAVALLQACTATPKRTLDQEFRSVAGGRDAVVVLEQGELRAAFAVANLNTASGGAIGGALSAVITAGVNQHRADKAETTVGALRDSLSGYDFDRHALKATQEALAKISWFDVKNVSFTKDGSKDKLAGTLAQSAAPQLLVARYDYSISPDCKRIAVLLDVSIFAKGADTPENQIAAEKALFTERFRFIRRIPEATRGADKNAALWAADGGAPARAAFDAGLAMVNDLLIRSLSQTSEAAAALDQGQEVHVGEETGKLVETSAKGTLLYDGRAGMWTFIERNTPSS